MNQIIITSLKIDGHPVEIPPGLSELLANCWVPGPIETKYLQDYDRKVIKRDGHFVTVLTKKRK